MSDVPANGRCLVISKLSQGYDGSIANVRRAPRDEVKAATNDPRDATSDLGPR